VNEAPRIGLALEGAARDPLIQTLSSAGYEVHIAADMSRVQSLLARDMMEAWIFDARSDRVFDLLRASGRFLLPADNPPSPADVAKFSNWAEGLLKQLDAGLADAAVQAVGDKVDLWSEVRGVWLLAGSAGATSAIQQFLNAFRAPPPVAFIYAQHYDPSKQYQLDSFTVQNTQFSLYVGEGVHSLSPARIIMIPPRCKVTVGSFGQISSTRSSWGGHHTPDINELLVILTAANLPSPGVIIFSGMGDDGAGALQVFDAAGGRIWAQDPATAVCHAMPQAAINTGLVHRSGNPVELARALEQLYR
jgi:chemosensory pili system protein ChpB (putative protein-glutamate methylesterase)